ncbi:hypothetical protein AYI70_g8093, partial [Smittium culicis]
MLQEILNRLTVLEESSAQPETASIPESVDMDPQVSYITERPLPADMELYKELQEALPTVTEDFFKSPLSDINRKKFFAAVPRNSAIDYDPPAVNFKFSSNARRIDTAIYDAQYRLSAITRPIDFFVHECIQGGNQVPISKVIEFANSIRILLADTATHLSQCRINQAYRDAGVETDT